MPNSQIPLRPRSYAQSHREEFNKTLRNSGIGVLLLRRLEA
jgi:hypothetical protein